MILAHNSMLYCFHKFLMPCLKEAPSKPDDILALAEGLMNEPSKERADAFYHSIVSFKDWPKPPEGWCSRFMIDTEWNWRTDEVPIEDR